MEMILAGTGHRPSLTGGYGDAAYERLTAFARSMLEGLSPDKVICGMALGWDQALAQACVAAKIPFVAAVAFEGVESIWPMASQERYRELLDAADEIKIVCEGGYTVWKLQERNMWMVDRCDKLLALWNGYGGGTCRCIRYAEKVGKPYVNCWVQWGEWRPPAASLD